MLTTTPQRAFTRTVLTGSSTNMSYIPTTTQGSATLGTVTRTTAAGSGTVSVTGLGFTPKVVAIIGTETAGEGYSHGYSNSTTNIALARGALFFESSNSFSTRSGAGDADYWGGTIGNFVSGGFDIVYTKTGSPPTDFTGYYVALP